MPKRKFLYSGSKIINSDFFCCVSFYACIHTNPPRARTRRAFSEGAFAGQISASTCPDRRGAGHGTAVDDLRRIVATSAADASSLSSSEEELLKVNSSVTPPSPS